MSDNGRTLVSANQYLKKIFKFNNYKNHLYHHFYGTNSEVDVTNYCTTNELRKFRKLPYNIRQISF